MHVDLRVEFSFKHTGICARQLHGSQIREGNGGSWPVSEISATSSGLES